MGEGLLRVRPPSWQSDLAGEGLGRGNWETFGRGGLCAVCSTGTSVSPAWEGVGAGSGVPQKGHQGLSLCGMKQETLV